MASSTYTLVIGRLQKHNWVLSLESFNQPSLAPVRPMVLNFWDATLERAKVISGDYMNCIYLYINCLV